MDRSITIDNDNDSGDVDDDGPDLSDVDEKGRWLSHDEIVGFDFG